MQVGFQAQTVNPLPTSSSLHSQHQGEGLEDTGQPVPKKMLPVLKAPGRHQESPRDPLPPPPPYPDAYCSALPADAFINGLS